MDPSIRLLVPILGVSFDGWWMQVSRRLIWVTAETEDEGKLLEPVLHDDDTGEFVAPLVATEATVILARMTKHPTDWAVSARVWPEAAIRSMDRQWSKIAGAIHGHGIPTITLDAVSTSLEVACQVVLKGYWHGYIGSDEPVLAKALAAAYPKEVERIRRGTAAPTPDSATAMLLEQLVRPGFDPAQGAEANRRYVRRKASIAVKEHKKRDSPDRYPWTQIGISERRYYKLLPLLVNKENGRYAVDDVAEIVTQMRALVNDREKQRVIRGAALEVLKAHGFGDAAARKWIQRNPPEEAVDAWPRSQQYR